MPWMWDPEHWKFRADEARTVAEQMNHPQAKDMMLTVALTYDRLAELAKTVNKPAAPPLQPALTNSTWKRRI